MDRDLLDEILDKESIFINGVYYDIKCKSELANTNKRYSENLKIATDEVHRLFMSGIDPDTIISLELTTNQKVLEYLVKLFANHYGVAVFDLIQSWKDTYGVHISDIEEI